MRSNSAKILNWNIEWKRFSSKAGKVIHKILGDEAAELICFTETYTENSPTGYHGLFSEADYGYPIISGRRKVALWSRTPWIESADTLPGAPSGRFISGITRTDTLGDIRLIGICVPWEGAHVSNGRKDRVRWQDHASFLECLLRHHDLMRNDLPTLLVGDFNQTFPPKRAPEAARKLLSEVVERFQMIPKAEPDIRSVCHMLLGGALEGAPVRDIPDHINDVRLSDHRGHVATLTHA